MDEYTFPSDDKVLPLLEEAKRHLEAALTMVNAMHVAARSTGDLWEGVGERPVRIVHKPDQVTLREMARLAMKRLQAAAYDVSQFYRVE